MIFFLSYFVAFFYRCFSYRVSFLVQLFIILTSGYVIEED